jgi:Flp pilus assembly protein TadB
MPEGLGRAKEKAEYQAKKPTRLRFVTSEKKYRANRMTLLDTALVLVVVGLLMWLINVYIPMAGGIKSLLNVVVFVVVLIWVLQGFGLVGQIPGVRIPKLM